MGENGDSRNGTASADGGSNGVHNGHSDSSKHRSSSKSKDKDRERRKETEEERRIRKEKERARKNETEEERKIRKEKERKERDERYKREGRETEEERKIRKEKERKEREERHKREGKKEETEEERRIRKEKERARGKETEEERRIRKEKEREKDRSRRKETDEERRERKERERRERKERERKEKEAAEQIKEEVKEEPEEEEEETMDTNEDEAEIKEEQTEDSEEEEKPLSRKRNKKRKAESSDEDESYDPSGGGSSSRKSRNNKKVKYEADDDEEEEEDYKPVKKEPKKKAPPAKKAPPPTPTKRGAKAKKEEETTEVWKWWEEKEQKKDDGTKWYFLEHKGPVFAPAYERIPKSVKFFYDGQHMKLSEPTEEVATFYGRMLDHDYTEKEVFNTNYFRDWRKVMNQQERETIKSLAKCDFRQINEHFKKVSEERKGRSKEEKKAEKERNEELLKEYGFCTIDGHKEKIGNFRIEPPSLFRGRGEHPKQGMLKKRVMPEDVIINCSKDSDIPEPPPGHSWKKVQHDNTVTWLASWTENIQNQIKYVMLNPSSKLKGEKDMMKYEKARELKKVIKTIRENYTADFKSKEMRLRQRSVALYFIDKLALRAGNEKDEDQADTVGCCSLRVEHITLHPEYEGKEYVVEFDFLGKDSIRYNNAVPVEKRVFKNVQLFMDNKKGSDDLFDRLNTSILNEYLTSLMPGLTAKVFRTYNASITLQEQLVELSDENDNIPAKMLSYNRANRAVAVLCNHQRAVPKTHEKSMENLKGKIETKQDQVSKAEKDFKNAKKAAKGGAGKAVLDKAKKALERAMEQLNRLETQAVDKEENKTIALGTSKLNYLDPRISVAWCKRLDVPIEKVYNKTQREKFRWAIDMATADYVF